MLSGSQGAVDEWETDWKLVIKCSTTTYSGSIGVTTTTTVTLTPTYSGCTAGGFLADINVNGCFYTLHADEKTGTETTSFPPVIHWENKYHTTTTIECPAGKEITIVAKQAGIVKCTIHMPPQNLGTGITLTNETTAGGVKDIKAHIAFDNIAYSETEGSGIGKCLPSSGTTNGPHAGSATISGKNTSGAATSIWMDPYTE